MSKTATVTIAICTQVFKPVNASIKSQILFISWALSLFRTILNPQDQAYLVWVASVDQGPRQPSLLQHQTFVKSYRILVEINKHIRLKAEFENFRRRKSEEISKLLQFEGESVIKGFLPILDDINRMINIENTSEKSLKDGLVLMDSKIQKYFVVK